MVTSDRQLIVSRRMVTESWQCINQLRAAADGNRKRFADSRSAIESSRKLLAELAAKANCDAQDKPARKARKWMRDFHVGDFVIVWRQSDGSIIL